MENHTYTNQQRGMSTHYLVAIDPSAELHDCSPTPANLQVLHW